MRNFFIPGFQLEGGTSPKPSWKPQQPYRLSCSGPLLSTRPFLLPPRQGKAYGIWLSGPLRTKFRKRHHLHKNLSFLPHGAHVHSRHLIFFRKSALKSAPPYVTHCFLTALVLSPAAALPHFPNEKMSPEKRTASRKARQPFRTVRTQYPSEGTNEVQKRTASYTGRQSLLNGRRLAENPPRQSVTAFSPAGREPAPGLGQAPARESGPEQRQRDACRKPQTRHTWTAASCPEASVHAGGTGRPLP